MHHRYHINLFWSDDDACWIADVPDLTRFLLPSKQMPPHTSSTTSLASLPGETSLACQRQYQCRVWPQQIGLKRGANRPGVRRLNLGALHGVDGLPPLQLALD